MSAGSNPAEGAILSVLVGLFGPVVVVCAGSPVLSAPGGFAGPVVVVCAGSPVLSVLVGLFGPVGSFGQLHYSDAP